MHSNDKNDCICVWNMLFLKKKMKRTLLLLFVMLLGISGVYAKNKLAMPFIGFWTCEETSVCKVIYLDRNNDLSIVCWDASDGELLEVSNIILKKNELRYTMRTPSTNWVIQSIFVPEGNNVLKETLVNQDGTYYFTYVRKG